MRKVVRINLLAAVAGTMIGLIGSAFFFCIENGYALLLAITRPDAAGAVPGWAIGGIIGAALVGLAVLLTQRFAPDTTGSGIQEIEGTLSGLRPPLRWRRIIPIKFAGGVMAMAAGMILGREGPTIHMGGALGAAVGDLFRTDEYDRKTLIAATAGAGLAVAFNAPLGGILFVVEELRDKFSITPIALNGVVVAALAATIAGVLILDPGRLLPITVFEAARWHELALTVPLAACLGIYAAFFNASIPRAQEVMRMVSSRIGRLPVALTVGGVIGILVALFPDATGGGEGLALRLLMHPPALLLLVVLLLLRTILFPICYAAGTPGGIFAPQLAVGTLLGLLYAEALTAVYPGLIAEPGMFAVAGMAGLLAATVGAPLTGAVLIAEMSGNYLLLPMMLVSAAVASLVAASLGSRPIYDVLLERTLRSGGAAVPVGK
jgi:CIC family chloride channel protein